MLQVPTLLILRIQKRMSFGRAPGRGIGSCSHYYKQDIAMIWMIVDSNNQICIVAECEFDGLFFENLK